jgi:hypothetical protein
MRLINTVLARERSEQRERDKARRDENNRENKRIEETRRGEASVILVICD